MSVHPTALVDPRAELAAGVHVGAYSVIGAGVVLGPGCVVESHVVLEGPARFGARNHVHSFAVLGGTPQRRTDPAPVAFGDLVVGDDNVFREHVTVHRGSSGDTRIGSRCLVMAGAHVAHDVSLESDVVLANLVQLAGHVVVEDHVNFGGMAGVAQRVRIGEGAFVAAGSMVERDVPPFVIVQGDRARVRAVNQVGLKRRQIPVGTRRAIQREFRRLYVAGEPGPAPTGELDPLLARFLAFHAARGR